MRPFRTAWNGFPDVLLHADEIRVKQHPAYATAKGGDADDAASLIEHFVSADAIERLACLVSGRSDVLLVSAHAYERSGVNAIPEALAEAAGLLLGLSVEHAIIQTNVVGHTGASGYARLARPALFDGAVQAGVSYVLVDDFIGQGGTLANLRGFIEHRGGRVLGATVLTGKPYSATIALNHQTLSALRRKHDDDFEGWWQERFGYAFDRLTESEARYLVRSPDADTIRTRLAEEEQEGSG